MKELNEIRSLRFMITSRVIWLIIAFLVHIAHVQAQYTQGQVIDKIIAKVDDYVVLKSDLERAYLDYMSRAQSNDPNARCGIFENLVLNKLMVAKAEIDSVIVEDSEVEANMDQRMQMILAQIGGENKLEEYYGKGIEEFKEELFDNIKEQLVVQRMQTTITSDISVTPSEVRKFFNRIPKDSLPYLSTEVSVGQIVKIPEIGTNQKEQARNQLLDIRNRILNGRDRTDEYGGWELEFLKGGNLVLLDKSRNIFSGKWEFDLKSRSMSITLNEISFSANEFQNKWILTKRSQDSIQFDNADINNTSKFRAKKLDNKIKESPVITMDLIVGKWKVVSFNENGEDFGALAAEYSDDPGSAKQGGNLGFATRGQMVPVFEAAAMRMKAGQMSLPVESEFGYHLIQLIERRGNEYNTRHILIRPDYTAVNFNAAEQFLDSIRLLILEDSMIFENMAKEYSDDTETAGTGGFLIDANGSSIVSVEDLDPVIFFTIDTMTVGDISLPMRYRMKDGKEAVRIIYYKDRIKPHMANFKDDYQKIQLAALSEKRALMVDDWFDEAKNEVFIQIDDEYKKCRILE